MLQNTKLRTKNLSKFSKIAIAHLHKNDYLICKKNKMCYIIFVMDKLPIIFIIGTVVYLKKSSSNTLRKIITIVISLVVVILICLGTNYIIINSI